MQLLKRLLDRLLAPWMRPADQLPDSWRMQAEYAAAEEQRYLAANCSMALLQRSVP